MTQRTQETQPEPHCEVNPSESASQQGTDDRKPEQEENMSDGEDSAADSVSATANDSITDDLDDGKGRTV